MIKMSAGRKTFIVFNTALLCLLSFLFIAPYLHIFAKALNEASDTALGKVGLWPNKWTFDNMMVILIDETTWYGFGMCTVSAITAPNPANITQNTTRYLSNPDIRK